MKIKCSKLFTAFMAVVLFTDVSVRASEMDEYIGSSAKDSYVFKTHLKDDRGSTQSKDGVVTLKGTVKEEPHRSLVQETVANLPRVKIVDNQLVFKGEASSQAQKELAGEYAGDVAGVKGVKNGITLAKNPNNTESTRKDR
jgi:osmotically-inducible protein OsmY